MKELNLFSGAGGGLLATKHLLGWETIGYVENEPYCQKVLRQRQIDGFLDKAPIFGDIRAFISEGCAELYRGVTDVITAGFPCQPFSIAGKGRSDKDERNMWPATLECIRLVRPGHIMLENVPAILNHPYMGYIFGSLAREGYYIPWDCISANALGAYHIRKRLWFTADPTGERWSVPGYKKKGRYELDRSDVNPWPTIANKGDSQIIGLLHGCVQKASAGGFFGMDDGLSEPVDRLKAIGNGQVPAVAALAWQILSGGEDDT